MSSWSFIFMKQHEEIPEIFRTFFNISIEFVEAMAKLCWVIFWYLLIVIMSSFTNNMDFWVAEYCYLTDLMSQLAQKSWFLKVLEFFDFFFFFFSFQYFSIWCFCFTLCQSCRPQAILLNRRLWQRCFPVNFPKFLRTPSDDCFYMFYVSYCIAAFQMYMHNV